MALPKNIYELRTDRNFEWERVGFKKVWNPICVFHTICTFINDLGIQYIEHEIERGQEKE